MYFVVDYHSQFQSLFRSLHERTLPRMKNQIGLGSTVCTVCILSSCFLIPFDLIRFMKVKTLITISQIITLDKFHTDVKGEKA